MAYIPLFERIVFGAPRPGYVTWQTYVDGLTRLIVDLSATAADLTCQFVFAHQRSLQGLRF